MTVTSIWKFLITHDVLRGVFEIPMPQGAQIFCTEWVTQPGQPGLYVWAYVNASNPYTGRTFEVTHTGQPFNAKGKNYIGTARAGIMVLHLFEEVNRS